jgi:hypothetical protein
MPDSITPPNTTRPSGGGGKGLGDWVTQHKGVAIGGLFVVLVGGYLLIRSRKSSAASSTTQNATGTPATVYPTSSGITGDTNQGDYYAGILNQLNSNDTALSSQLTGLQTGITTAINGLTSVTNPSTGATNTGSASGSQVGEGTIDLPGIGQSVILGQLNSADKVVGYNVGGGAPVYFGNANAVAQGLQYVQPNNFAYTPVQYESLVSPTATATGQ